MWSSPGWPRSSDLEVNSFLLYQLSYRGMRHRVTPEPIIGVRGEWSTRNSTPYWDPTH